MGFKADSSFLKFLSMGAAGARQVMAQMRNAGFEPIELERYCTSNKIWSTKVKRLRLPDLLCVRTGLRVEVRAKSDLKIRMSDAPANPDRRWHSGLRDADLSAFIACEDADGTPVPAAEAVFFKVADLKKTENTAQLGPPKSASEGAERDRTWSSIVPARSGVVEAVGNGQIRVSMDADNERPARSQTYSLKDKSPYVKPAERFVGGASIIAGTPARRETLEAYKNDAYKPLDAIAAPNAVDRYAAVKSLPFRPDLKAQAASIIEQRLDIEADERVLLEAAGAGSALNSNKARERLEGFVWNQERADLRMETVFILTELRSASAADILKKIATDTRFQDDEIRQAAVWGLGKAGLKRYADLISFVGDADPDVSLHAIVGFGSDTSKEVIDQLIGLLLSGDPKRAPAASEALRLIGSDLVLQALISASRGGYTLNSWVVVTLGRLEPAKVRAALQGNPLLRQIEPLFLLSSTENWLAVDSVDIDLKFLIKQNL
jgi:hypothetical protein